jgi:hypothetical protein
MCDTHKPAKIGAVNATAWLFWPEDLVKTKLIITSLHKEHKQDFLFF